MKQIPFEFMRDAKRHQLTETAKHTLEDLHVNHKRYGDKGPAPRDRLRLNAWIVLRLEERFNPKQLKLINAEAVRDHLEALLGASKA